MSVTLFYNLYDDLRTTEYSVGKMLPVRLLNGLEGQNWGVEAWATQQLLPWWRVQLGVSTLGRKFSVKPGRTDLTNGEAAGNDPDYNAVFRSQMTWDKVDLDVSLRAVDDLPRPAVPAYVEADARLGWRINAFATATALYLFLINDFGMPAMTRFAALRRRPDARLLCAQRLHLGTSPPNAANPSSPAFPDALDLLLICVESGMSIEAAIQKVSGRGRLQPPSSWPRS